MDPISIATSACSLAMVAIKVSKGIYDVVQSVKNVDRRLLSLSDEIVALGQCLAAVQACLEDKQLLNLARKVPQIKVLEAARTTLNNCENVLSRLDSLVLGINKKGRTPVFLRKSTSALRLSMDAEEIAESRDTIRLFIASLQVVMSSVHTLITAQARSREELTQSEADKLATAVPKSVHMLQEKMKRAASSRNSTASVDGNFKQRAAKQVRLEKYIENAAELCSIATTYVESTNGSIIHIDDVRNPPERVPEADPNTAANTRRIEQWNSDQTAGDWMAEEKEDHTKMILGRRLDLAQTKLTARKYEAAQTLYTTCIAEMELLADYTPHELQDARINLFHAYRKQKKYTEGLDVLNTIADTNGLPPADLCLLAHLRAETYLEQNKSDVALPYALQAMQKRYEMPDASRHLYIQSSNLVADIYVALGEKEESELYRQTTSQEEVVQISSAVLRDHDGTVRPSQCTSRPEAQSVSAKAKITRLLLQEGHDLTYPSGVNKALIWAIETQHDEAFRFCLSIGADVNYDGATCWASLEYAASVGSAAYIEDLLKHGAYIDSFPNTDWTALMAAASNGHFEAAQVLIANGAALDIETAENETALHLADAGGHYSIVGLLQEAGAAQ
ncbi:hypothetical protein VTL71DRAFT_10986 [Oculimacula yallundae]|uniref:Azaphilone pigments biosynthesis cluster protein L N-terminal domain-containing protein n=1 Tax=Oculimacula yallundae TaxID=86028 RepID=A0ABR4CUY4_9HELO